MSDDKIELVIEWAQQNFPKRYDLYELDTILFVIILLIPIDGFFLFLWLGDVFLGKPNYGLMVMFFIFLALIIYLIIHRRKVAIYIDSDGVKNRGGKKLLWSKLLSVEFASVAKTSVSNSVRIDDKKFRAILKFQNGVAIIPHRPELDKILLDIPTRKTDSRGNF